MKKFRMLLGVYSRVAASLGLDRSHVRRVAIGQRRSARVQAALDVEFERINQTAEQGRRKGRKAA